VAAALVATGSPLPSRAPVGADSTLAAAVHLVPARGLNGPAAQVLALTNAQRTRNGCRPLAVDSHLTSAAQQHSDDMARTGFFSHTSKSGKGWEAREIASGFSSERTGGENIAFGQTSAKQVVNTWMHSPPHRRNILDCQFTTIGIGYAANGHYWTQDFGF
jgi:uncharacterized protein YkwD